MERLNITLDAERSAKIIRLADRMHVQPGSLARSLLSSAIDEASRDARNLVECSTGYRAPSNGSAGVAGRSTRGARASA